MNSVFVGKPNYKQVLDPEAEFMLKEINSDPNYLDIKNYMFWDNVNQTSFLHLNIARSYDKILKSMNITYERNDKPLEMLKCEDFNSHKFFSKENNIKQLPKMTDIPNNRGHVDEDDFVQGSPLERVVFRLS
jgi:hypothetical protein